MANSQTEPLQLSDQKKKKSKSLEPVLLDETEETEEQKEQRAKMKKYYRNRYSSYLQLLQTQKLEAEKVQ